MILVQVDGHFAPRWLVKRLSLVVPDHDQSDGFSILAKHNWKGEINGKELAKFWQSIYEQSKTTSSDPAEIIRELCDRCIGKPLIMAIHNVDVLEPTILRKVLSFFWEPLVKEICNRGWGNARGDCILFLTANSNTNSTIEKIAHLLGSHSNSAHDNTYFLPQHYGVDLEPWTEVTGQHMNQWIKSKKLKELIDSCYNETTIFLPAGTKDTDLLGSPEAMLQKICAAADLNGCEDLEKYWKIAL